MDLEGAREMNHFQTSDGVPLAKRVKAEVMPVVAASPALTKLLRTDSPSSPRSARQPILAEDGRLTLEGVLSRGSNKPQLLSSASPSVVHSLHNSQQSSQRCDPPLVVSTVIGEGDDPPPLQQLSQSAPGSGRNSPASVRYSSRPGSPYVVLGPGQSGRHLGHRLVSVYPSANGSPVAEATTMHSTISMADGRRLPVAEVLKELHQYGIVGTMYKSGVCMWPNCLEPCSSVPAFACHLYSQHGLGHQTSAQLQVQGSVVQHLQQTHTLENQRLAAMTAHLQILATATATAAKSPPRPQLHQDPSEGKVTMNRLPTMPALLSTNHRVEQPPPRHFPEAPRHNRVPPPIMPRPGVSLSQPLTTQPLLSSTEPIIEITAQDLEFYQNSDQRPPFTYAALIRAAIMSSSKRQLTLFGIYNWLSTHFKCFDENSTTWKNAVRHNLSLHKYFKRIDLENHKGGVWMVDDLLYWSKRRASRSVTEDGKLKAEVRNARHQYHRELQRRSFGTSSPLLQHDKMMKEESSPSPIPPTQLTPTQPTTDTVESALDTVLFMPPQTEMEEPSDVETVQVHYVTQNHPSEDDDDDERAGPAISYHTHGSRKALRPMRVAVENTDGADEEEVHYSSSAVTGEEAEDESSLVAFLPPDQEQAEQLGRSNLEEEEVVMLAAGSPDDEGGLIVDEDLITSDQEN